MINYLFFLSAIIFFPFHEFHITHTTFHYNDESQSLEITIKVAIEDLEKSILYYSSSPFVLDSIVQVVRDTLEHKFLQISHDELENNDSTSSFKSVLKNYPYLNSHNVNKNFIFNSSSKDSIIDYFSKHPELLGKYSFEEFVYSVNNMKKK